jgi:hypothetical protein
MKAFVKGFATVIATAFLAAGPGVGNAQTASPGGPPSTRANPSINGTALYCQSMSGGQTLNCIYASMAACRSATNGPTATCVANPRPSTTGAGGK